MPHARMPHARMLEIRPRDHCACVGALEGAYQIATGALRSLSEQQLIDCSVTFGNMGCKGGSMRMAFDYILANKGIDSEADYPYSGTGPNACWKAAANRTVAMLTKFTAVPTASESALVAATALGPVSVAIEADHPVFQHYKSGVVRHGTLNLSRLCLLIITYVRVLCPCR
jgi:hypothetical protein